MTAGTRAVPTAAKAVAGAGVALMVLGVVLVLWRVSPWATASFGWFAYSSGVDGSEPTLFVATPLDLWGGAAFALGLACVTAATGYVLGVRRTAAPGPPTAT